MKPGTVKPTDVGSVVPLDQATPVAEVDPVVQQRKVNLDELPEGRSQLPPRPASTVESPGESPLVRSRVDAHEEEPHKPKGKRQKFLKVPDAKGLTKQAKVLFKGLTEILDGGVQTLRKRRDVSADFGSEDA